MKALFINAVCGIRSTGRICADLAKELEQQGYEVKIAYSRETVPPKYRKYAIRIGNNIDVYWHALMSLLFDDRGYWSKCATKKFIKWASEYNPDLLWLHNIHDYVVNIDMLFEWVKSRPNMEVRWTQHDCWAFTGHCAYFTMVKCSQWKTQCICCPRLYHDSIINRCSRNFKRKYRSFTGIKNMTLITPSIWLSNLIKSSFLKEYPIKVINNTIDSKIFKPTLSNFRKQYNLIDKNIILGVAAIWDARKGFDDFIKLRYLMDSSFAIVLVGLTKKQISTLPKGIIGIERTNSSRELAEIYSAADVFLNLTYEDNYPTVNLEAQACGTPCISYRTGGSPESVNPVNVVDVGDLYSVKERIIDITNIKIK